MKKITSLKWRPSAVQFMWLKTVDANLMGCIIRTTGGWDYFIMKNNKGSVIRHTGTFANAKAGGDILLDRALKKRKKR